MIAIDAKSPVPPFEQLRAQLADQIHSGTLAVGTRLPTVRRYASDLGLAPNTVARAYRELEEAGLIETRGRAGTFVAAAGRYSRERAHRAALDYAAAVSGLGLTLEETLGIVEAALRTTQPHEGYGIRRKQEATSEPSSQSTPGQAIQVESSEMREVSH